MHNVKKVKIDNFFDIGDNKKRFTFIGGPCAIESEEMSLKVAEYLKEVCESLDINFVFKSSYDKANRSSIHSPRGVGIDKGMEILSKVKSEFNVPVITDVHDPFQCEIVSEVVDIIQIPAFLCRQTDLLIAAAKTGKALNIKKGQFLAPWDMKNVIHKVEEAGSEKILLCERGTTFGYNNLTVDMTGIVEMRNLNYPVVFDATHAVQKPGGKGLSTGGNREFVFPLMRAALAIGVDAIFAEVHPDPDNAFSDGPNQLYLEHIKDILENAVRIDDIARNI
ncbi:3-deoxy-8-phosphooctulonate synthase [Priestia aryabhattai]|uniref:3-deoxy-8-phosphooctulonate synthase n=1 Tax=Priestia aryabhattai TaxID=412384 RepID=UPI000532A956|nr:3-deoxy-8-phosphooctulonate synthase [Priestia aryabhattai]